MNTKNVLPSSFSPSSWPQGYASWDGSFDELVSEATAILMHLDPQAKSLTPRTVRHYQHTQVIGRGQKEGRSARFGFSDLASVVSAKGLVKEGWTLNHAAKLLNSSTQPSYELPSVLYEKTNQPGSAADAVMSLMGKAGLLGGATSMTSSLPAQVSSGHVLANKFAPGQVLHSAIASLPPQPVQTVEYSSPTPWMQIYLDKHKMHQASDIERQLARDHLVALLNQLHL